MDTSKGKEEIYKVDTTNYKKSAGHEEEEPQKEDVKITHVPLTYEKRETGDSLAAKLAEKIESAKETVTGAGADEHNKND